MWSSAIACKCFCATWPFLILCSPLPQRRDSVCDVPQDNWPLLAVTLMVPLTPSLLPESHPMVMLKPVPVSENCERRIVRLLWFQRYSRTYSSWSWKTWKCDMDFGQRRNPNTKPGITDALGTRNHLGPLYYSFPRNTQTHLCEGACLSLKGWCLLGKAGTSLGMEDVEVPPRYYSFEIKGHSGKGMRIGRTVLY